ncbi:MAG TPA: protein kinase [Candidatus Angelobacter sp.]|nr:protein kinase [Candidatus Angelobacter sp.]
MDEKKAKRIFAKLKGKEVGNWRVEEYIGHGKSAVVFLAKDSTRRAALKIFDLELIEKYGSEQQIKRIDRERELIGQKHKHLVEIYDGGLCSRTKVHYVVMQRIRGPALSECLAKVPRQKIWLVISQIAEAAKCLEQLKIAHRDIKPANIAMTKGFTHSTLLDLGVIRPVGLENITDHDRNRPFVGTLRYSPPEFLLREEADTLEGWRAVTIYQLGAVLHDLIMGCPIFPEIEEPYARLVEAILHKAPRVACADLPLPLVNLAQNCLVKDPIMRLKLVSWDDFIPKKNENGALLEIKREIRTRQIALRLQIEADIGTHKRSRTIPSDQLLHELAEALHDAIREDCVSSNQFPPISIESVFYDDVCSTRIVVSFQPNNEPIFPYYMTLVILIELVSPKESILEIKYVAAVSQAEISLESLSTQPMETLIRGVANQEEIRRRVNLLMFGLLAEALISPSFAEEGGGTSAIKTLKLRH